MSTKILIIEDDESITFAIKAFLKRRRFQVDAAVTFLEAKESLNRTEYDLVITDLSLGKNDASPGMQFITFLRSEFPKLKILVLSGKCGRETGKKLVELGASLYLKKPVPLTILAGSIEALLKDPPRQSQA